MTTERIADFRSDTVSRPTPAMLEAMASAEVGDDVLGDDPTVSALEERVAALFGHEASLFMPSGTMSNQAAVAAHVQPGEEVLVGADAHLFVYEGGGLSRVAGAHVHALPTARGVIDTDAILASIRQPSEHMTRTALVCLEQTHMASGGSIVPLEQMVAIRDLTLSRGIPLHLDGARIFNAAAETGVPFADYGALADSVSVSLCKGLCCPVGSLLIGSGAFIERARRVRKWLGGGMRQAGYLAAPAFVALDEVLPRLSEDNARARELAAGIIALPGVQIAQETVDTNLLFVDVMSRSIDAPGLAAALADHGVLALPLGERRIRFVTHQDVADADVDRAVRAMQEVLPTT